MTDEDLKKFRTVIKEELVPVNERLTGIENQLNDPKTGLKRVNEKLDALWGQTEKLTFQMEEVLETTKSNSQNTHKLNKRTKTVEAKLGISAPPEFTI